MARRRVAGRLFTYSSHGARARLDASGADLFRVRYIPPANPFGREGVITNPTNAAVRTGRRATEALCGEYNRSVDTHPSHIMW